MAFVVFEAAYLAEIIRAGIQSVPRGQVEAAEADGAPLLGYDAVRHPAAGRPKHAAVPGHPVHHLGEGHVPHPLFIGYMDLTKAAQTVNQREIRPFECTLFIAVVYWVLTFGMSLGSRALERRMAAGAATRRIAEAGS